MTTDTSNASAPPQPRLPVEHTLKTEPRFFEAVRSGVKLFEIRRNDRGFAVGDRLRLCEYDPKRVPCYTGREVMKTVLYVTDFPSGVRDGYVVMSLGAAWPD